MDPFAVHRPARAFQQGMHEPIVPERMAATKDCAAVAGTITLGRARTAQHLGDAPLRDAVVLDAVTGCGPLLAGRYHFF